MAWGIDGAVANGAANGFLEFNNTLFVRGSAWGLYRRVAAGNWVRVAVAGGPIYTRGTACVWNGLIWDVGTDNIVYRSPDGINWTADLNVPAAYGGNTTAGMCLGGSPLTTYLILTHNDSASWHYYAHRDTAGVWTNNVATRQGYVFAQCHAIIEHLGFIWVSGGFAGLPALTTNDRWDGTAWVIDLDVVRREVLYSPFIPHAGTLFGLMDQAVTQDMQSIRWNTSRNDWDVPITIDTNILIGGSLSLGADGRLYIGLERANGAADARIFARDNASGNWVLVGKSDSATLGNFGSVGATLYQGALFFVEGSAVADNIYLNTPSYVVHGPTGGGAGEGLAAQSMAVDGNGAALYLGLYDNANNPVAVKVQLPLSPTSIGQAIHAPGAGDAINVETTLTDDEVVLGGFFGNNDQVESSVNGGAAFTDIDTGGWGANRAQPIKPALRNLTDIHLALHILDDFYETPDGGTTWNQTNAALPYDLGAMAGRGGCHEVVIGNLAAAARQIDYSYDEAATLENITGGFSGGVAALQKARN